MDKSILFIFSGLPAVGKSTLAKFIAQKFHAFYLRIDTLEQALKDVCKIKVEEEGYRIAYRIAEENLSLGLNVVADSCNPIKLTREEWENVARKYHNPLLNIEIICTDKEEHKRRAEERFSDIENLQLPRWEEIIHREYHPWHKERMVVDTAGKTITQCEEELLQKIKNILQN